MKPKLLKSSQLGEFIPAEYSGVNESGYEPLGDRVLVLPDMATNVTSGGVELPADIVDRTTMAAETGVIIAIGEDAFKWTFDKTRPWDAPKPKPGDRIYCERYSGQVMLGEDGKFYRLMDYQCVGAVKRISDLSVETKMAITKFAVGDFPNQVGQMNKIVQSVGTSRAADMVYEAGAKDMIYDAVAKKGKQ